MQLGDYPESENELDALFENLSLPELRRRRSYKWARYPDPVIPAWVAEMDFPVAAPIRRALGDLVERGDWGYPPHLEYSGARETVAQWASDQMQWPVQADSVFVLADALKGVELVLATQLPPGSGVIITPPIYYPFFTIPRATGQVGVEVPLREKDGLWSLDLDQMERAMQASTPRVRAVLLCHPHNPTGTVFPDSDLHALADLCERYGVLVVSDEVHGLLELGKPRRWRPYSLFHRDPETVFTATSTAKAWNTAGLKSGLLVAHGERARCDLASLPHRMKSGVSLPGLVAMEATLRHGQPWLQACRDHLAARRTQVQSALERLDCVYSYEPPQASYLAWIQLAEIKSRLRGAETLRDFFVREAQVAISDGSEFGSAYGSWIRLNFATSSRVLDTIMERIRAAIERAVSRGGAI